MMTARDKNIELIRHPYLTLDDGRCCKELTSRLLDTDPAYFQHDQIAGWSFEDTKRYDYAWTVAKKDGIFIGYSFVLPATIRQMFNFIWGGMSDAFLLNEVKDQITYDNFNAIYICSYASQPDSWEDARFALTDTIDKMLALRPKKYTPIFSRPRTKIGLEEAIRGQKLLSERGIDSFIRTEDGIVLVPEGFSPHIAQYAAASEKSSS